VAPLQVQGPASRDVLRALVGDAIDGLRYYRCMKSEIAGLPVVISRSGWSGELGYEIMPRTDERAMELFDAVLAAGEPHGMLVSAPNLPKALEAGISDTAYYTNLGLNALEFGRDTLVDLDGDAPFMGKEALRRIREEGVRRRVVGLRGPDGVRLPRLDTFWEVVDDGGAEIGRTRWNVFSPALGCSIALAVVAIGHAEPGTALTVRHPEGETRMTVDALPFVDASARARA
jgi:aminomethyltransferase